MEIKPVKKYIKPEYPDYEVYVHHPAELAKYIPESWKGKKAVIGAFMAFILSGQINASEGDQKDSKTQIVLSDDALLTATIIKREHKRAAKKCGGVYSAPVFNFGEGRGTTGCLAVNPPVFISENEARMIILDEFKQSGITFDEQDKVLKNVTFTKYRKKPRLIFPGEVNEEVYIPIVLDGYNSKLNLAFSFISQKDWEEYNTEEIMSSIYKVETKKIAEEVRKKLYEYKKINSVIFYDPVIDYKKRISSQSEGTQPNMAKDRSTIKQECVTEAKELLRKQVQSFIEWLKTEGKLQAETIKKGK